MAGEQEYYDGLNKKTNEDLIQQGKQERIKLNNAEIRLDMICNILINRGVNPQITQYYFDYHRFEGNPNE